MLQLYSALNSNSIRNIDNGNHGILPAIRNFHTLSASQKPITATTLQNYTSFASAIYANGPFSLEHPNVTTDFLAQNTDYLA